MRTVCCLALSVAVGCGASGSSTTGGDAPRLDAAIDAANRANQPLIIELGATWCKPCHVFADRVLTDPRIQAALRAVTFVQYDIDTPAGADALHRTNLAGVPAIVSVDRTGHVLASRTGTAPTADEFLEFLHAIPPR